MRSTDFPLYEGEEKMDEISFFDSELLSENLIFSESEKREA